MGLSYDLISQFVKTTNDSKKDIKETIAYGTIVEYDGSKWVRLDGSDLLTPISTTTDVQDDERVTVMIKNHTAIVTGNISSPAARTDDVKDLGIVVATKVSATELETETARIENLFANYATIEKLNAATAEIANLKAEDANIKNLFADYATIEHLEATYATIANLSATTAEIANLKAEDANIKKLFADYATIAQLEAANAEIDNLKAEDARINKLCANFATIGQLEAVEADIELLDAGIANIDTLIFGSATGTTIQTSFSNSVIAQLGDAQIKSAMIDSLSASKITAGKISTNLVEIGSDDGSMLFADETIQINDGTRVRVQIGKDASGDYSISVWDAEGKLMFSEGGITEDAVKDAIIRNDMVSDTANISASKLDIDSLFEEINGSNKTIKSTRVYLNEEKQTLDVAFTQMTTDVEGLSDDVSSQGTAISVIQGQISSKIWQQDIDTAKGEMNTQYSNLEQSLDGFKMEVGNSYATKSDLASINLAGGNMLSCTKEFAGDDTNDYEFALNSIVETNYDGGFVVRGSEFGGVELAAYYGVVPSNEGATYTFSFYGTTNFGNTNYFDVHNGIEVHIVDGDSELTNVVSSQGVDNVSMSDNNCSAVAKFTLHGSEFTRCWVTFTLGSSAATPKSIKIVFNDDGGGPLGGYVYGCMLEKSDTVSDEWSGSFTESIGPIVSEKVTALEVKVDSISSRVSATETNIQNNYYTITQTNTQIDQKADSIISTVSKTYATQSSVTALDSKIEQLPDKINLAVSEVTIGGNNLLGGTKKFTMLSDDTPGFSYGDSVETESVYQGFNVRYLKSTTSTYGYNEFAHYTRALEVEPGAQYTFSFYAKGTKIRSHLYNGGYKVVKGVSSQGVSNAASDGSMDFTLTSEWERYWVTYTVEETNTQSSSINKNVLLRVMNGYEAYVCGLMFEKGNKASDWSPHPEDTNDKFASLSVTVNGIYSDVYDSTGKFSKLQQTVNGISTRVGTAEGDVSILKQTATSLTSRIGTAEGNITTLTLTANSLTATLNGLVIGCTNLLRNTRYPKDASYWTSGNVVKDSDLNENVFYISNSASSELTAGTNRIRVEAGKEYTVSAYVKRTANVGSIDFFFLSRKKGETTEFTINQHKNGMTPTANTWEKLTWTFTMDSNAYEGYLRIDHNGSTNGAEAILYYTMVKMEKGNKATDWTPSPQEVDERVAKASETATNYLSFTSAGLVVGNHTATTLRGNVLIDTDSVDIRQGTTVLATYGGNSIQLGQSSGTNNNVLIDTDSVDIRQGTTTLASFAANSINLGKTSGTNNNVYVDTDSVDIRQGTTVLSSFQGNDIYLGNNAMTATIHLCADIGAIVGYEDAYGMGININAYNLSFDATNRIRFNAYKDPGTGPWAESAINVFAGDTNGSVEERIHLYTMGRGSSTDGIDTSEIVVENKKISLYTEDADTSASNSIVVTPTQVEIKSGLKINGRTYAQNQILWSGSWYMTSGQICTLSQNVQNQPNGIALVFSEYYNETVSNTAFHTVFVPKQIVSSHGGSGHCFQLSTSNLAYFATKYLYISDTQVKGHDNNNLTGASTCGITRTNTRFILRYIIGV